eukprot:15432402-Alexandrium_andersonii.AAC.1
MGVLAPPRFLGSRAHSVIWPSGHQNWPRPRNPARELAIPARPTSQAALSAARNLRKFGAPLA